MRQSLVWDLPTRLFHWGLVACVAIAAGSGFLAPEWWLDWHAVAGYGVGILLAFRLAWGFVGGRYSRFAALILAPGRLVRHLRQVAARRPQHSVGHDPAGSWMILALLALLGAIVVSGLIALGGQEGQGPLAFLLSFAAGRVAMTWHEVLAFLLLAAVGLHVSGVLFESRLSKVPLVAAMIHGRKRVAAEDADPGGPRARRGALVFATAAGLLLAGGGLLAGLPASGWQPLATPERYAGECGDCHHAHHPSLRTAADWRQLMAGLEDHFGEDASLDPADVAGIGGFLVANAAERFDTEAANLMGGARADSITSGAAWKARHEGLTDALFKSKPVGSPANCDACHRDAAGGRFADSAIELPKENVK
ncbi:MAG: cytochrome b/b6 domain-containing protein [Alphaproteobacteria bacterium]|nr:cytochrome b/b6 domain-containing protein [Alphaproteobacteria bacterium]MDP7429509.1 cytochrome b/b6 domain-containing protein [Alphaproteobacteria bacterium]